MAVLLVNLEIEYHLFLDVGLEFLDNLTSALLLEVQLRGAVQDSLHHLGLDVLLREAFLHSAGLLG